ncbi:hypothetical protein CN326_22000 [Bacillus sp. AFS018417]|uniref:hypothetical protein n=1 Tax=Bacillus sp. AFS018417 TaxID=2033491 RepID=UPI000BF2ADA9|nr:hypothetical protein [Bacillus sp. AFS018417]PEZ01005.1 hypothetical protein CN326_22000 [Bacillus sp. AFS018417]
MKKFLGELMFYHIWREDPHLKREAVGGGSSITIGAFLGIWTDYKTSLVYDARRVDGPFLMFFIIAEVSIVALVSIMIGERTNKYFTSLLVL